MEYIGCLFLVPISLVHIYAYINPYIKKKKKSQSGKLMGSVLFIGAWLYLLMKYIFNRADNLSLWIFKY